MSHRGDVAPWISITLGVLDKRDIAVAESTGGQGQRDVLTSWSRCSPAATVEWESVGRSPCPLGLRHATKPAHNATRPILFQVAPRAPLATAAGDRVG